MPRPAPSIWKQMPFVRLVISLMVGIMLQWYLKFSLFSIIAFLVAIGAALLAQTFLSFSLKYTYRWLTGLLIGFFLVSIGSLITYNEDIRHHKDWLGNKYTDNIPVMATLGEPLVEKAKSYKAEANVEAMQVNGEWINVKGKILLYINKDSSVPALKYGSQVLFVKSLQPIKNSGNPGGFDYQRYNAFQDIYHQVFLKQKDYVVLQTTHPNWFKQRLIDARLWVIGTLQKYIHSSREVGVAEALLIGYRDDLDKDLVQAYSNTGVVHIIAISGLHLGMIYGVLAWVFKFFKRTKWTMFLKAIVILLVLWLFTFIAGGVPSIMRSAVMFTCIVLAEVINRRTSIYNTLAASAFVMLCCNPFFLWDVGFQLSYAAVISIVLFVKPIDNWFYIKNKLLSFFWKLAAITLAAQILTIPIIFYYFHQFPNLFLLTNFIVVPLSSLILFAEIALLIVSSVPMLAYGVSYITTGMLWLMNTFIERLNELPFAVSTGIQNSVTETIILYVIIVAFCYWLYNKSKQAFFTGLLATLLFISLKSFNTLQYKTQAKLVVYNVPKLQGIDLIEGMKYHFIGDTALMQDGFLKNFHIQPSRILHHISAGVQFNDLQIGYPFIQFHGKRILLADRSFSFITSQRIPVDLIILSKNAKLNISQLASSFVCPLYVFDGSNSLWKINQWKKECDNLHLPRYCTPDQGAFEWDL